jgi:hypothetical protein
MTILTDTFIAPSHWASAFINGDTSGLDESDYEAFEEFCIRLDDPHVVDCSSHTFIGRFDGLMTELCEYTFSYLEGSL